MLSFRCHTPAEPIATAAVGDVRCLEDLRVMVRAFTFRGFPIVDGDFFAGHAQPEMHMEPFFGVGRFWRKGREQNYWDPGSIGSVFSLSIWLLPISSFGASMG